MSRYPGSICGARAAGNAVAAAKRKAFQLAARLVAFAYARPISRHQGVHHG